MSSGWVTIHAGETILARDVNQYKTQLYIWVDSGVDIELDCVDLKHIDGSGIGLLALVRSKLMLDKCELKLHNLAGQPAFMLKTLGIYKLLTGENHV